MNWTEKLAKILRDKVVRSVNGVTPTDGEVALVSSPFNLLLDSNQSLMPFNNKSWTHDSKFVTGERAVALAGKTVSVSVDIENGPEQKTHLGVFYLNASGARTVIKVPVTPAYIEAGASGTFTTTLVVPTDITDRLEVCVLGAIQDWTANIGHEMINLGNYPMPYAPAVVTSFGGQLPDSEGNIDMSAYATQSGDNVWSGHNEFTGTGGLPNAEAFRKGTFDFNATSGSFIMQIESSAGTYKNGPTNPGADEGEFGWGTAVAFDDGVQGTQLVFPDNGQYVHMRIRDANGKWKVWTRLATDSDITSLNNKISALEAQISGGAVNLIDRTGELVGQMLSADGTQQAFDASDLMANHIPVQPGHILKFAVTGVYLNNSYAFRWNYYDSTGQYMGRQSTAINNFEWIVPDGVASIWVSYPSTGEVSLTDVTIIETRIELLEAKMVATTATTTTA
ncbi:hypothetical protein [Lacticaseibacillus sharpeae]|uniref:Uncharacterized protein n=1 Tax=Lacticaseibacillus sharpeae JCM 1186 = DSM 20505 TaxID=1291052 RepID=A0A0R1ZIQ7_9LACO|nr:hypothetical protein [Lacticaseibacillus sharpeae]KRM54824.1 hypothetical protein FC18_GL002241 [Lacticaseibacillus sharpeae JCM 1186 = DSM 20505]